MNSHYYHLPNLNQKILSILHIFLFSLVLLFETSYSQSLVVQEQYDAWESFNNKHEEKWKITWNHATGTPQRIYGFTSKKYKDSPEKLLKKFLKDLKDVYKWNEIKDNFLFDSVLEVFDTKIYSYKQIFKDIPVFRGEFFLYQKNNDDLTMSFSSFYKDIDISIIPAISSVEAIEKVKEYLNDFSNTTYPNEPYLMIYPDEYEYHLVWAIEVETLPNFPKLILVDANSTIVQKEIKMFAGIDGMANVYQIDPTYGLTRNLIFPPKSRQ